MDMSSIAEAVEIENPDGPFAGLAAAFLGGMEFRQVDDRVYLKFPLFTSMLGAETDWISMPAEEGDELTSGLTFVPTDPAEIIEAHGNAAATVEEIGVETVNGVEATHYRISLDTEAMELTEAERAELEATGIFADGITPWTSGSAPRDTWCGWSWRSMGPAWISLPKSRSRP